MPAVASLEAPKLESYCHDRFLLVRMRAKKKGTPTRAVITPIGKMMPGMMDLLTTEVDRQHQRPGDRRGRQKETLIFADQHSGDVRPDQTDEADGADESHRNGGEQR